MAFVIVVFMLFVVIVMVVVPRLSDIHREILVNRRQIQDMEEATHRASLRIMKTLKGESYVGHFGEFEVHTDSSIPQGGMGIVLPKQED
jgi:hypothetical protein